jgi:hypothetical protein
MSTREVEAMLALERKYVALSLSAEPKDPKIVELARKEYERSCARVRRTQQSRREQEEWSKGWEPPENPTFEYLFPDGIREMKVGVRLHTLNKQA